MPHPVTLAAETAAAEHVDYPPAVVHAATILYDSTLELLTRRPLFGAVAESLAFGCLSVADYLGPDTVGFTIANHRAHPADGLLRERFGR